VSTEQARSLLARAIQTLDHVQGKNKQDACAVELVQRLLSAADDELSGKPPLPPLEVPPGARQGISVEPRAEWRRR
jgi:hypothetical protein